MPRTVNGTGHHQSGVERGAAGGGGGAVRGHFLGARAAAPLENCFVPFELWPRLGVALARLRVEGDQRASTGTYKTPDDHVSVAF